MTNPITFVDDPALERALGPDLAQEVKDAIQPPGDCSACNLTLGTGPLRIDVQSDGEGAYVAYPRHASCRPAPNVQNLLVLRNEHTHLVNAALTDLALPTPAPKRPWWRLSRPEPQIQHEPFVVFLINPSIDGFFIGHGETSLIDRYMQRDEFHQPDGGIRIEDPPPDSALTLEVEPELVTVVDGPTRYEIDSAKLANFVRDYGGALVAVTYRHWVSTLESDPQTLTRVMNDPTGTAITWIPHTPTEEPR